MYLSCYTLITQNCDNSCIVLIAIFFSGIPAKSLDLTAGAGALSDLTVRAGTAGLHKWSGCAHALSIIFQARQPSHSI